MVQVPDTRDRMQANLGAGPFEMSVDLNTRKLGLLFERVPRLTFFHMRDTLGAIYGSHRREWLQRTQAKFRPRGIKADNLRSGNADARPRHGGTFVYNVEPAAKAPPAGTDVNLEQISAESFSTSKIALGLEQGGTHTARRGRLLALPIGVTLDSAGRPKSRWVTPGAYKRSGARNRLVAIKFRGRAPVLYQVKGGRSKKAAETPGAFGRTVKGESKPQILLPAYVLVPRVRRRALLRYGATWEELESDRDRRIGVAADKIIGDAERGREV